MSLKIVTITCPECDRGTLEVPMNYGTMNGSAECRCTYCHRYFHVRYDYTNSTERIKEIW